MSTESSLSFPSSEEEAEYEAYCDFIDSLYGDPSPEDLGEVDIDSMLSFEDAYNNGYRPGMNPGGYDFIRDAP